nr:Phosphotransferase enzyme family [uncultured bacterium]
MAFIPNFSQPPADTLLQWVRAAVDPHSEIVEIRPLEGGSSSTLYSITLRTGEMLREVVLRQYDNLEWLAEEPDLARHEAAGLLWTEKTGLPTPRLLAVDKTGRVSGIPALVMTKLPGAVVLRPPDMAGWLEGLAETLARIHRFEVKYFPWNYLPLY